MNHGWQLHFGEEETPEGIKPKWFMNVTNEQFEIIKQFADTERDENLIVTFILNKAKFRAVALPPPMAKGGEA